MPAIGGSIESVTLNGRNFAVAADVDSQRKKGGFENDVQANGDGSTRTIKTRVPWSISGLTINVDDDNDDQDFLQLLADGNIDFPIGVTYVPGHTFQGTGQITGELTYSNSNATATVNLMGSQQLTRQ